MDERESYTILRMSWNLQKDFIVLFLILEYTYNITELNINYNNWSYKTPWNGSYLQSYIDEETQGCVNLGMAYKVKRDQNWIKNKINYSNRKTLSLAFYLVSDFLFWQFSHYWTKKKKRTNQHEAGTVVILQFCTKGAFSNWLGVFRNILDLSYLCILRDTGKA